MNKIIRLSVPVTALAVAAGAVLAPSPASATAYACLVTAATPVDDTTARWKVTRDGNWNIYDPGLGTGLITRPVGSYVDPTWHFIGYAPARYKVDSVDGTIKWRYDVKCQGYVAKSKWNKKKKRYVKKRVWRSRTVARYAMESVYSWSGWYSSETEAKAAALQGESTYLPGDIWYGN